MEITLIILAVLVGGLTFLMLRAWMRMKNIKETPESQKIKILTDQNFKNQIRSGVVLVDFWAAWCMPCKLMVPILNQIAEDPDNKAMIAKLNVDEQRRTAADYGIRNIPTSVIFKNGREVERIIGVKSVDQIRRQISKHL
jgi:thioredoxin 1